MVFQDNLFQFSGFLLIIADGQEYYRLLGFAEEKDLPHYKDFIFSVFDSFAFDYTYRYKPGPVSDFLYSFPSDKYKLAEIPFLGVISNVLFDMEQSNNVQAIIEREARVLSSYGQLHNEAWQRYYQIIFKECYSKFYPIYNILRTQFPQPIDKQELSTRLLKWLQGFEYFRPDTLSDLLNPIEALFKQKGDCDARGLIFVILLKHFGIDSILMVSSLYQHSMVAIDIPGTGARFQFNNKKYLVAETTDNVSIGLIDREMSNINGWLGISF